MLAALAALAEHRLQARPWSPSSLQHFAVCPYRSRCTGSTACVLATKPMPIEQMDPLTRGALFHEVQFALLGELRNRQTAPGQPRPRS